RVAASIAREQEDAAEIRAMVGEAEEGKRRLELALATHSTGKGPVASEARDTLDAVNAAITQAVQKLAATEQELAQYTKVRAEAIAQAAHWAGKIDSMARTLVSYAFAGTKTSQNAFCIGDTPSSAVTGWNDAKKWDDAVFAGCKKSINVRSDEQHCRGFIRGKRGTEPFGEPGPRNTIRQERRHDAASGQRRQRMQPVRNRRHRRLGRRLREQQQRRRARKNDTGQTMDTQSGLQQQRKGRKSDNGQQREGKAQRLADHSEAAGSTRARSRRGRRRVSNRKGEAAPAGTRRRHQGTALRHAQEQHPASGTRTEPTREGRNEQRGRAPTQQHEQGHGTGNASRQRRRTGHSQHRTARTAITGNMPRRHKLERENGRVRSSGTAQHCRVPAHSGVATGKTHDAVRRENCNGEELPRRKKGCRATRPKKSGKQARKKGQEGAQNQGHREHSETKGEALRQQEKTRKGARHTRTHTTRNTWLVKLTPFSVGDRERRTTSTQQQGDTARKQTLERGQATKKGRRKAPEDTRQRHKSTGTKRGCSEERKHIGHKDRGAQEEERAASSTHLAPQRKTHNRKGEKNTNAWTLTCLVARQGTANRHKDKKR
ncbi:hypothetical protein, conserved in T. vivax, (fragment), partial [Trypanosoma vivax Y486]